MAIDFRDFKAKRDDVDFALCMTLPEHTWRVVRAGVALADRLPYGKEEREHWKRKVVRCAIWHDIGKIHPAFQKNLKAGRVLTSIRHEIISVWMCEQCLGLEDDEIFAIATHHKGIISNGPGKRLCQEDFTNHLDVFLNEASGASLMQQTPDIVAKWAVMFSDDTPQKQAPANFLQNPLSTKMVGFLKERSQKETLAERRQFALMRGLLMAADHLGSSLQEAELPNFKAIHPTDFYPVKRVDGKKLRIPFRSFQKNLQSYRGDCLLHAPTGSGKTEAALSWIHANQQGNSKVFYLLPFTASINAMVKRLQTVYGKSRVTALHSKALDFFYDEAMQEGGNYEQSETQAKNKLSASHELFYPVKVATLHQILKHALHGKGWDMAMHDYQNALFIVDEFHAYDAHLTGTMLATLQMLQSKCGIRIMMMSATIPSFLTKLIAEKALGDDVSKIIRPNPIEPSDAAILDRIRHKLVCHTAKTILDELGLIEERLKDAKNKVLIVVNNVTTCQRLGKDLQHYEPILLHGGFNREDRKEIEGRITNENPKMRPRLLIATQAVEVSLDIDYSVAFIENAPIDALIQRFGRVNRSGKGKLPATIHLFQNSIGNVSRIYPNRLVETWDAMLALQGKELSEQTLMEVCDAVYKEGYSEAEQADFEIGFGIDRIQRFHEMIVAGDWQEWIEDVIEQSSMKIEVLCENLLSKFIQRRNEGKFIEAAQLLVQVYPWVVPKDQRIEKKDLGIIVAQNFEYHEIGAVKKQRGAGVFLDDF